MESTIPLETVTGLELPAHLEIVKKASDELGLSFELVDNYAKDFAQISDGSSSIIVKDQQYFCNTYTNISLAKDKFHTDRILKKHDIKTPEGKTFFVKEEDGKTSRGINDAINYAEKTGYPLFFKPLDGSYGDFARVINSTAELCEIIISMSVEYNGFIIQQLVTGHEHRLFVIEGKPIFSYRKLIPTLKGNGVDSVTTLLQNSPYDNEQRRAFLLETFGTNSFTPAADSEIPLAPNANPNAGGIIDDFRTEFPDDVIEWAAKITNAMGLTVLGVDLFSPDTIDSGVDTFSILEVNGNPFLKTIYSYGYSHTAIGIWKYLLSKHFGINQTGEAENLQLLSAS